MARRRAPARRWHVGDRCQVPWYGRPGRRGDVGGWSDGVVVAVRRGRVVVRRYRWEFEHPWWEPRVPPRPWKGCRYGR